MTISLPINPSLPPNFDQTPNDERSIKDLDAWWDKPFAIKREDGPYDVHCLDGGAWDRSTSYGHAKDLPAAIALAETKLAAWQKIRAEPVVGMGSGKCQVIRPSQRPDQEPIVLKECKSMQEAQSFIAKIMKASS